MNSLIVIIEKFNGRAFFIHKFALKNFPKKLCSRVLLPRVRCLTDSNRL